MYIYPEQELMQTRSGKPPRSMTVGSHNLDSQKLTGRVANPRVKDGTLFRIPLRNQRYPKDIRSYIYIYIYIYAHKPLQS